MNGYSQAALAAALDVTEMTINRWENDKVAIPRTVELALRHLETRKGRRIR